MRKNIYEIFDEFKAATTKEERVKVLKDNDSPVLRNVLLGTLDDRIKFVFKEIPPYNREEVPPGMSYENMSSVLNRIYLFMEFHPRLPLSLTMERKKQILTQILESLEPREAEVFSNILLKNKKDPYRVPYLTASLVNTAFPGLIYVFNPDIQTS